MTPFRLDGWSGSNRPAAAAFRLTQQLPDIGLFTGLLCFTGREREAASRERECRAQSERERERREGHGGNGPGGESNPAPCDEATAVLRTAPAVFRRRVILYLPNELCAIMSDTVLNKSV